MKKIKAIETEYNGYRFRSRLEARWAVFFDSLGIEYEYEIEGFEIDGVRYLPDFYIPSIDRWFEIKGKPLSISEIKKCEAFCQGKDPYNIKYSILIGAPKLAEFNGFVGVIEYMWEWPSERFPESVLLRCSSDFCEKDYFSRFIKGIYVINATKEEIIDACDKARQAQFEFGKTPVKIVK